MTHRALVQHQIVPGRMPSVVSGSSTGMRVASLRSWLGRARLDLDEPSNGRKQVEAAETTFSGNASDFQRLDWRLLQN